jgi:aminopeptidase N
MKSNRWRQAIAATVTLVVATTTAAAAPALAAGTQRAVPGASGVGDRLFPDLGNGGYEVDHYDLAMTYDPRTRLVEASTTVRAVATQTLSRFDLDLDGPTVREVTVDGLRAGFTRSGGELVVTPPRALPAGAAFRTEVQYTADPRAATSCVIPDAVDATSAWNATTDGFFTAAQPGCAHTIFPSNDHPSDPASYSFAITVPTGTTAITNGVPTGTHVDGSTTTWRYEQREPMASELIQIAVGDYTVVTGTGPHGMPLRSAVTAGKETATAKAVADTGRQIAWMESQVGRYPFATYGLLAAPTFFSALETQTLSVFDAADLAGSERDWAPLTVHELSHQWFGDSVVPGTWSDLWLNEGHATWYESRYAERLGAYRLEDRMRDAYRQSNQWRHDFGPPARPSRAKTMFSENVYDGGALVLFALRQKVGDPTFQRIERAWAQGHRGRVADTSDFVDVASRVAGYDLRGYLGPWLYGATVPPMPGHPDWTATKAGP